MRDDGIGIDPAVLAQGRPGHYGITGMHERANKMGATLSFDRPQGGGTEVLLSLDLATAPAG